MKNKGFTLVELSIVLVIIGLLIGGILVAQSMIATVKVTRLVSDLQKYEIAVNNFYTNYKVYPGDDPYFTPPGAPDGVFGYGDTDGNGLPNIAILCNGGYDNRESDQVWAHLSQAKMLDKTYPIIDYDCAATQTSADYAAGKYTPYLEFSGKTADYMASTKTAIFFGKISGGNFWRC